MQGSLFTADGQPNDASARFRVIRGVNVGTLAVVVHQRKGFHLCNMLRYVSFEGDNVDNFTYIMRGCN